jgi:hypothetical protein
MKKSEYNVVKITDIKETVKALEVRRGMIKIFLLAETNHHAKKDLINELERINLEITNIDRLYARCNN